jgi:mRNA interferase MazF
MEGLSNMKDKIVLVPFPFDDLSTTKVRPAVCLTNEIKPYGHVVLAFITSQVSTHTSRTDLKILDSDQDFRVTGLKVSSTVRLHRLMTVSRSIIKRELGAISLVQQNEIKQRLKDLFDI